CDDASLLPAEDWQKLKSQSPADSIATAPPQIPTNRQLETLTILFRQLKLLKTMRLWIFQKGCLHRLQFLAKNTLV
ncbi:MAG: hypothetical protein ACPGSB_08505, partial [Opitutales bacterium]